MEKETLCLFYYFTILNLKLLILPSVQFSSVTQSSTIYLKVFDMTHTDSEVAVAPPHDSALITEI